MAVPAALLCAALLFGYAFAQQQQTGSFGLSRFSGWPLYFARGDWSADCPRFTPPPGTAGLCQSIPSSRRPGPDAYTWTSQSPAVRLFGLPPSGGGKLGAFARAAILAQPGEPVRRRSRLCPLHRPGDDCSWPVVGRQRADTRAGPDIAIIGGAQPAGRAGILPPVPAGAPTAWDRRSFGDPGAGSFEIHGWMIGLGILLAISGMILAPDRATRSGLALLLLGGSR